MLLMEARLKFIEDVMTLNQLEELMSDGFLKNFWNELKFEDGPVISQICGV